MRCVLYHPCTLVPSATAPLRNRSLTRTFSGSVYSLNVRLISIPLLLFLLQASFGSAARRFIMFSDFSPRLIFLFFSRSSSSRHSDALSVVLGESAQFWTLEEISAVLLPLCLILLYSDLSYLESVDFESPQGSSEHVAPNPHGLYEGPETSFQSSLFSFSARPYS